MYVASDQAHESLESPWGFPYNMHDIISVTVYSTDHYRLITTLHTVLYLLCSTLIGIYHSYCNCLVKSDDVSILQLES